MRRMPVATSETATTVADCQTSLLVAAIVLALSSLGRSGGADQAALGLEHPLDQPTDPHAAGVDIQAVELVVRVGVDGLLLGLQHCFILTEHAMDAVAKLRGDELAVQPIVAHEGPEVMAGFCRFPG